MLPISVTRGWKAVYVIQIFAPRCESSPDKHWEYCPWPRLSRDLNLTPPPINKYCPSVL